MKLMRIVISPLCIAICALIVLNACDDNTMDVGKTITHNDNLTITNDTFEIQSRSIAADSVLSRNTIAYLGNIKDPETGMYITGDCMIQFHSLENYQFPHTDSIASKIDGKIVADSCEIRLFYKDFFGDTLSNMKLTAYEMDKPMIENKDYYSNFDPFAQGYIRKSGVVEDKNYSLHQVKVMPGGNNTQIREYNNIRIPLNRAYKDKSGKTYNNFGTYIMQKYYESPQYFKNYYSFIRNVVPGFFFKHKSGIGSMAYIEKSQLNVYFRYKHKDKDGKDAIQVGIASFSGTEEVLQTSYIQNDKHVIKQLLDDNTCTYLKTPSGVFTEITFPIDQIYANHEKETLNAVKLELQGLNQVVNNSKALPAPKQLLIIPKDSLSSFFSKRKTIDNKSSFIATYNKTYNHYTFNNISGLIKSMKEHADKANPNYNKAVLVPVTASVDKDEQTTIVVHNMGLTNIRLVGGSQNKRKPLTISAIYTKFK